MLLFANLWNQSLDYVLKMENFQLNGKKYKKAHKKGDKQNLKNYLPISLPPVAGKILERILYACIEYC